MRDRNRVWLFAILAGVLVILVVLIIIIAFRPRAAWEQSIENDDDWCKPVEYSPVNPESMGFTLRENPHYWDHQVVVTGDPADIERAVLEVQSTLGLTFSLLDEVPILVPETVRSLLASATGLPLPPPTAVAGSPQPTLSAVPQQVPQASSVGGTPAGTPVIPVIRFYEFTEKRPVPGNPVKVQKVIVTFRDAVKGLAKDSDGEIIFAVAEPNYVVSIGPHGISAGPHGISGGPHGISGGPHGISGGLLGLLGGSSKSEVDGALRIFERQWAFQLDSGIELMDTGGNLNPAVTASGLLPDNPSQVLVFDSSPFAIEGLWEIVRSEWEMELCVHLPETHYMEDVFGGKSTKTSEGLSKTRMNGPEVLPVNPAIEHGLFVSGLVNAVAPGARIHLIRVIDDEGFGDMFSVIRMMHAVLTEEYKYSAVNMSFGMHIHEGEQDQEIHPETLRAIREMAELANLPKLPEGVEPVIALRIPFQLTELNHSFVAAASGNGSAGVLTQNDMDYPGKYGEIPINGTTLAILAIGASTAARDWTCYSNDAHVLAPNGDGKIPWSSSPYYTGPSYHCIPAAQKCPNIADRPCRFGVVSLVTTATADEGYAYWSGTSFSSPMVAGLAALVLENHTPPGSDPPEPADVKQAILAGTCPSRAYRMTLHQRPINLGIINVPRTLDPTRNCPSP